MLFIERITRSNFFIRLKNWEYWPFGIVQFPAFMHWIWLSLRAGTPVFFSAANPGIPMGGMFGESKYDILKKIPTRYVPRTLLFPPQSKVTEIIKTIADEGLRFPLIMKPDIGERGYRVCRINGEEELEAYVKEANADFLVQECIDLPMEFGVFYMRMPDETNGKVISLVAKEMLSVTGDGCSTLQELILSKERARLQWTRLSVTHAARLKAVVPLGEEIQLVAIGNHCMGTRFIDANRLITDQLSKTFDEISLNISGFYFGRYDLRCESLEDLYSGNVRILELNGCGAEPGHIYGEGFSFWQALRVPAIYWGYIYKIARKNRMAGLPYVTLREAIGYYRKFKSAVR